MLDGHPPDYTVLHDRLWIFYYHCDGRLKFNLCLNSLCSQFVLKYSGYLNIYRRNLICIFNIRQISFPSILILFAQIRFGEFRRYLTYLRTSGFHGSSTFLSGFYCFKYITFTFIEKILQHIDWLLSNYSVNNGCCKVMTVTATEE
jgi:hypothetical protein